MQEWVTLSDMTLARTEHGLAVINDIPTVVGGVEQLDSSNDQNLACQRQWRLVAQALSVPRYFGVAQIPTSRVNRLVCKSL